jgi:hypothetical protein
MVSVPPGSIAQLISELLHVVDDSRTVQVCLALFQSRQSAKVNELMITNSACKVIILDIGFQSELIVCSGQYSTFPLRLYFMFWTVCATSFILNLVLIV